MTNRPAKSASENLGPLVLLVGGCGMLNLLVVGIGSNPGAEFIIAPLMGAALGGFTAPVVWGVLAPQSIVPRLAASLGMIAWLLGTLFLGGVMAEGMPPDAEEMAAGILMVPIVLLAAQLPVWILRASMGCRLAVGVEGLVEAPKGARQFRVRDLLVTTAVLAACLGLGQWGTRLMEPGNPADATAALAGACCFAAMVSAVVLLPGIWAALIVRNKALGAAVYFGLAGAAWLTIVIVGSIFDRGPLPPPAIVAVFAFFAVLAGTVLGSLHTLRACGLTLVWPRRKRPQDALGEPTTPFAVIEAEGVDEEGGEG